MAHLPTRPPPRPPSPMRQAPTMSSVIIQVPEAESSDKSRDARACPLCGRVGSRGYDDVRHLNSQMHYKYRPLVCPLTLTTCVSRELPNMRALLEHFHMHVASGEGEQLSNAWKRMQSMSPPAPAPTARMEQRPVLPPLAYGEPMAVDPPRIQQRVWPHSFMNPLPAPHPPSPPTRLRYHSDTYPYHPGSPVPSSSRPSLSPSDLKLPPLQLPVRARSVSEGIVGSASESSTGPPRHDRAIQLPSISREPPRYAPYERAHHKPLGAPGELQDVSDQPSSSTLGDSDAKEEHEATKIREASEDGEAIDVDNAPAVPYRLRRVWEDDWSSSRSS